MDDIASCRILLIFYLPIYGLLIWQYIDIDKKIM